MNINRRNFIKGVSAATATIAGAGVFSSTFAAFHAAPKNQIAFFTKLMDGFETGFLCETLAMAGIDGLDVTVRPGGKIEPEKVKDEMPKLVETARKSGLKTEMMVTSIAHPDDLFAKDILETAAREGVKHYRTAWFKYDLKKDVSESLKEFTSQLEALAAINKTLGISAGYQNHSGVSFGSPVWDLWLAIKDLPPKYMGAQYDVRHAVVESTNSWIAGLNLLKNNISSIALKDFRWEVSGKKASVISVPLGEGLVDFDLYFKTLKELQITAPITLHVEYALLNTAEAKLSLTEQQKILVPKIKHEVDFIRSYLKKYGLE
ncbi:MAG: sugar phosphate isomerase/epimerase family protein [Draconibacterium sp.]